MVAAFLAPCACNGAEPEKGHGLGDADADAASWSDVILQVPTMILD